MRTYICQSCGLEVRRYPCVVRRAKGVVYCSRACSAQQQRRTGRSAPCDWCHAPTYRKPSEVRARVYCSRVCSNQAQSKMLAEHPELRTGKGSPTHCLQCDREFFVKPHMVARRKFCSRRCASIARFGKSNGRDVSGPRNPNYRATGNRTTARQVAFARYPRACIVCGFADAVDVHHITPRRHGGTNEPSNLVVLCPNHHRLADLGTLTTDDLIRYRRAANA